MLHPGLKGSERKHERIFFLHAICDVPEALRPACVRARAQFIKVKDLVDKPADESAAKGAISVAL